MINPDLVSAVLVAAGDVHMNPIIRNILRRP
jgi:hypothetical protein